MFYTIIIHLLTIHESLININSIYICICKDRISVYSPTFQKNLSDPFKIRALLGPNTEAPSRFSIKIRIGENYAIKTILPGVLHAATITKVAGKP